MRKYYPKLSAILPAATLLLISFAIIGLPLFNYLGYEFSAVIALCVPWIFGFRAMKTIRRRSLSGGTFDVGKFRSAVIDTWVECLSVLVIPVAIATAAMAVVKNCSYGEGLIFFLLLPVITTVWSVAVAACCVAVFRRSALAYTIVLVVVMLYPVYLGYALPQIYSYNFIYGFFPGFSYDEILTISPTLVLFRIITLILAGWCVSYAEFVLSQRKNQSRKSFRLSRSHLPSQRSFIVLLVTSAILIPSWIFRDTWGFESSVSTIRQSLGAHYTTDHFQIYYSRSSFSEEEIQYVAAMHEFRFHQVTSALIVNFPGRIASYVYPDAETMRRCIGTGITNIAKPWRREIHLNKEAWKTVLKHELVHVIAGEFGMPVIKAHYHIGLVEGLAMAIDQDFGNHTLAEYARAMLKFEIVHDPAQLIKPVGFALQSSSVSYVMMGSFCRFLIDRYGIVHFKELYGGRSVENVYGMTYDQLTQEWRHYLERTEAPDEWRQHVEFYFKRPSIFAKECARAIARANDNAGRALQHGNPVAAIELFHRALVMSWNTESYSGLVRAAFGAARYDSVINLVAEQMKDSLREAGIVNLFLLYGDALWYRNDDVGARTMYERILSLDLSPGYNEAAALRLAVLSSPQLRTKLAGVFVGSPGDSSSRRYLDSLSAVIASPLLPYLLAKVDFRHEKYVDALHKLESIHGTLSSPFMDARKEELLGEACCMTKQYQTARIHFWQSLNFVSTKSSSDRIGDWLQRCEWFEQHGDKYLGR